jgi:PGF-pre-PGF domain-containing protein
MGIAGALLVLLVCVVLLVLPTLADPNAGDYDTIETVQISNGTATFSYPNVKSVIPEIEFQDKEVQGNVRVSIIVNRPDREVPIIFDMAVESSKDSMDTPPIITFQVPEDWIKKRGVAKENVMLYSEMYKRWELLSSNFDGYVGTQPKYVQYKANFTDFSFPKSYVFMIRAEPKETANFGISSWMIITIFTFIFIIVTFIIKLFSA